MYEFINKNKLIFKKMMEKMANPWTGKTKQRGEGMLNSIIEKHFPELENEQEGNDLEMEAKMVAKIKKKMKIHKSLNEYKNIFSIKKRIDKLNELLDWLD